MASGGILNCIFKHQLLMTQEIKERLKDHLTDELIAAFVDNEEFLKKLQDQEEIQQLDLERLQQMWENLTQSIDRTQANLQTQGTPLYTQESLKNFFAHQLLLTQEIKEQLKDHLTDDLLAAFADNEAFLKKLQSQEEVHASDFEKLQKMLENLTQSIDSMQDTLKTEITVLQKQELVNHIYNH